MSRALTYDVVMEELQQVLHDLHDLSMFGTNKPFRGIVFRDIEFVWRDDPLSRWMIRIEPSNEPYPRKLIDILTDMEEQDEEIRAGEDH